MTLCGFLPYGVCMLCVLTLSSSSWLCATSLLGCTWMWAIIQGESAGCLWQQNYLLAQNCFEWDLLFALALIRMPLSHSLSLYLALIVPLKCAPPPSVFFFCISDKHTPVFAKGERERAGNRLLEHRPKRSAPCSFLFCFFFSFFFCEGWVLTQDKVSGSGV